MEAFADLLSVNKLATLTNSHLFSENTKECTRIHTLELIKKTPFFHEAKGVDK